METEKKLNEIESKMTGCFEVEIVLCDRDQRNTLQDEQLA